MLNYNARETINEMVETTLTENGFENTPQNRKTLMEGIRDAWNELPETSLGKSVYVFTITAMIMDEYIAIIREDF